MIGYGAMLIETARKNGFNVVEWRASSLLSLLPLRGRLRKLSLNIDRFVLTPLLLLGRKADIIHVVDPGNCIYLPLTRHRRSVVTVHDLIPWLAMEGSLEGFSPSRTGRWLMERIAAQLERVDRIIVVSEASRRDLLKRVNVSSEQVQVIYNAAFQAMSPAPDDACVAFRNLLGLPPKAPLILHIGRNFYKNRSVVLKVAAKVLKEIPEVRLVLVGRLTAEQSALAEQLILDNVLHVVNHVKTEDMALLYSTAAVLLFPSLYEGFGLPVLEARMCGTPIVCSNAGSLPEVAGPDTILLGPSEVDEMALACVRLISAEARPDAELPDLFDAEKWANVHRDLYRCLFRGHDTH